ncbi:hypothetical protein BCV50_07790 [Bacillus subtilis]|nr:hypothetical protein BCV50_07790 [Bacillus subtilis]
MHFSACLELVSIKKILLSFNEERLKDFFNAATLSKVIFINSLLVPTSKVEKDRTLVNTATANITRVSFINNLILFLASTLNI